MRQAACPEAQAATDQDENVAAAFLDPGTWAATSRTHLRGHRAIQKVRPVSSCARGQGAKSAQKLHFFFFLLKKTFSISSRFRFPQESTWGLSAFRPPRHGGLRWWHTGEAARPAGPAGPEAGPLGAEPQTPAEASLRPPGVPALVLVQGLRNAHPVGRHSKALPETRVTAGPERCRGPGQSVRASRDRRPCRTHWVGRSAGRTRAH